MIPYKDPQNLLKDLLLWYELIRTTVRLVRPTFENRMINKEARKRLKHSRGKISDEELQIELDAIAAKRKAHNQ